MANQARVEELADSDPEEMDIEDVEPSPAALQHTQNTTLTDPTNIPVQSQSEAARERAYREAGDAKKERTKGWHCLYPLYFDASRTLAEGRRVGKNLAVKNPLAREIVDALQMLGVDFLFEPTKTHPKDWANPGRVRVQLKEEGRTVAPNLENKHHLLVKVAEYLQQHPTSEKTPLRLKLPGMGPQTEPLPPPARPRGWKMGKVLPLHSPAVTGGGVSDNLFKDMMQEMQGGGMIENNGGGGSGGKGKKDKKKAK